MNVHRFHGLNLKDLEGTLIVFFLEIFQLLHFTACFLETDSVEFSSGAIIYGHNEDMRDL